MIILGIDPGIATVGFAVIEKQALQMRLIDMGTLTTPAGIDVGQRLVMLREDLASLLTTYTPHYAAIEQLFFAKNTKTALTVAHARGVLLECMVSKGLEVHEFTPLQVKQMITGYGNADKKQMQDMLQLLFKLSAPLRQDDAADALGIAVSLAQQITFLKKL